MNSNENDDNILNEYLEGNSEISKQYKTSSIKTPSVYIDENILLAAKQSVEQVDNKSRTQKKRSPWVLPVSIAAVITLSVSLVINMQQQTGQFLINDPKESNDAMTLPYDEDDSSSVEMDAAAPMLEEIEAHQFSDEALSNDMPTALGAVGGYHEQTQRQRLEGEKTEKAVLAIQKELSKKKELLEQQSAASSAVRLRAIDTQEKDLTESLTEEEIAISTIKSLFESGDFNLAAERLKQFNNKYPDYSQADLIEMFGVEILTEIQHK